MQTLRKKNSPCKSKNEPTRFLGEGLSFKAKLIGILEVPEARGDRMCQAALADLKMAIRAAGEHKQRIAIQVSIDGLRLRDEKTGECLYHHPVYKISFISHDMSDTRAFGYIFGSPDTGHRFFGIKTDKAASQVVVAIRELFQIVFDLKKKEVELAKKQIEQTVINAVKLRTSGICVEPAPDTKGAAGTESSLHRMRTTNSEVEKPAERKDESQSGVIADLLDLQFELNSLQQGIHEMDKITPGKPLPSNEDPFESDPFGDSFANMKLKDTVQPILPPPPASSSKRSHLERQQTIPGPQSSGTSSPATIPSKTPPPHPSSMHWFDKETENLFTDNEISNLPKLTPSKKDTDETPQARSPQIDVFTELDPLGTGLIKPYVDKKDFFQHLKNPPKKVLNDLVSNDTSDNSFPTTFHVADDSVESIKPQSSLITRDNDRLEDTNFANFDRFEEKDAIPTLLAQTESPQKKDTTPRPSHHQPLSVSLPPEESTIPKTSSAATISNTPTNVTNLNRMEKDSTESIHALVKLPSPKKYLQSVRKKDFDFDMATSRGQSIDKSFTVDFSGTSDSPASPLRSCSSDANSRLSSSSAELDLVPEPPPRGVSSILINPPPLPPKKQNVRGVIKPPPRPPHTDTHFHYDFPERARAPASPTAREKYKSPLEETKAQFDDNFSPPVQASTKSELLSSMTSSVFEDSFSSMIPTTNLSSFFTNSTTGTSTPLSSKKAKPALDITLSQLTSSNLDELANSLGMAVQELTSLTLQQLTECLANLSTRDSAPSSTEEGSSSKRQSVSSVKTEVQSSLPLSQAQSYSSSLQQSNFTSSDPPFKTNFDRESKPDPTYDKYAVFRELLELEQMEQEQRHEDARHEQMEEAGPPETKNEHEPIEEEKESEKFETQPEVHNICVSASLAALASVTVRLPPPEDYFAREEAAGKIEESHDPFTELTMNKSSSKESDDNERLPEKELMVETLDMPEISTTQPKEDNVEMEPEREELPMEMVDDKREPSIRDSEANSSSERETIDNIAAESSASPAPEKMEVKLSTSTSNDRYAALREIIGEPEPVMSKEDEGSSPARMSPVVQPPTQSKNLADVELLNLFSDPLPPPSSPKKSQKKEEDLKAVAMDIFEEIKMLNTGNHRTRESKPPSTGFEDVFCPFTEARSDKEESKDDGNWAKFDAGVFGSDRSSGEGPRSVGGTSPWSPDGKEFHRESSFKGSINRHSGDSDNEWKDEEESEESNGRLRGDARFWCTGYPRFEGPGFDERGFYEEPPGKRDRSFREGMGRKTRGAPWGKAPAHRQPRDPSLWHDEGQWEEEPRHHSHRKMTYKDDDDQYEGHWKCRPKPQRWKRGPDHAVYYDDERKRRLMLWNEKDRFGSQESMCYDEDESWSRRKYERRRWEEDPRFATRRVGPPPPMDGDYPMRETYYYYRESRERPHGYPPAWDEEYGPDRPGDDSPRYNPSGRKRHWPKRPTSANEGRSGEMGYSEPRGKFGSRSECGDNDSDLYLRPSQRSRSRECYWGSDQEYDSWAERPYWSECPDTKSESLHRKRIPRHKAGRQPPAKTQSPFEDDFAQTTEHVESPATETLAPTEPRIRSDSGEPKRESAPSATSPTASAKCPPKDHFVVFEYDLASATSAASDSSDRQRASVELKTTPEELHCDTKEQHQTIDGFASEDAGRDSFFNGDLRYEDDAFAFKQDTLEAILLKRELEDNVPDHRATTLPLKNSRQVKYNAGSNNNNNKSGVLDYIRKSESVNIFLRENDPFDDDDFFN